MMVDPLKIAIVGVGHIAQHQIEAIALLSGRAVLVGAYDRDAGVADKFAGLCRFHASLDELIAQSSADVVVVSTPNRDHVHTVGALLAAGRAVMVEKPVCENAADLRTLCDAAAAGGVFLHTALHAAFAPDLIWWQDNKAMLETRLGALHGVHMGFYDPYISDDGTVAKGALGLGGSWYDSGINALSVLERIADPGSLRLTAARMFAAPGLACAQVNGAADLALTVQGGGCTAHLDTNWMLGINRKTALLSYARGAVLLDHTGQTVVIREVDGQVQSINLQNGQSRLTNQYVGVFADLVRAFAARRDNQGLSQELHRLLFAAAACESVRG